MYKKTENIRLKHMISKMKRKTFHPKRKYELELQDLKDELQKFRPRDIIAKSGVKRHAYNAFLSGRTTRPNYQVIRALQDAVNLQYDDITSFRI